MGLPRMAEKSMRSGENEPETIRVFAERHSESWAPISQDCRSERSGDGRNLDGSVHKLPTGSAGTT